MFVFLLFVSAVANTLALDNGLALTPPMGWLSWERFRCNIDCDNDPKHCISEQLYKDMADRMAADGYKDVGYEYVIIDDCWMEKERDSQGFLQADKKRFPNGIKHLADYIHSKGLKFGIYTDYGTLTCAKYPGLIGHMEDDANTFAKWEIDYLKVDGCNVDPKTMDVGYPEFGRYLNKTGRPIVYSCEWPFYQHQALLPMPDYAAIAKTCNLWRNFNDIDDSWTSVLDILDFNIIIQDAIVPHAGPGGWNDPDMLIIGNYGLSYDQARAQMALWAIMASPLLMSVDLRTIKDEFKQILLNKPVIAVNQDVLGKQGYHVMNNDNIQIWMKPVTPVVDYTSFAIAILSRRTDGMPFTTSFNLNKIGLNSTNGYKMYDLFDYKDFGVYKPHQNFTTPVNPTGVVMLKAEILSA